ncbi:unnamed protein product, partial [marine sediment metagenome]
ELRITKGDVAEDVEVHICAPPVFSFPRQETYTLPPEHRYPNYIGMIWALPRVIKGLSWSKTVTIKAPPTADTYNIVFYKFCRGFADEPVERQIIVQ